MNLPVLEKEALQLPDAERAHLADRLLASLPSGTEATRQQWITESESRLEAYRNGKIKAMDGPATMTSLRDRFVR
jgi:putative addiction module component (TIGR02574 family)